MMYPQVWELDKRDPTHMACKLRAIQQFNALYGAQLRTSKWLMSVLDPGFNDDATKSGRATAYIGYTGVLRGGDAGMPFLSVYKREASRFTEALHTDADLYHYPWFLAPFWRLVSKHLSEMKQ